LFHLKNRLKTRVALIELLDLSGIAVGNVGVPTCLNLRWGWLQVVGKSLSSSSRRPQLIIKNFELMDDGRWTGFFFSLFIKM
jgi:hypothetical protein